MELKVGKPLFVHGSRHDVNSLMHNLSVALQKKGKVLFIDTLNSIDIYHPTYQSARQVELFRNIHCVRTEKPYDMLARLRNTGRFIQKNNIKSILVNSVTNFWEDSEDDEIIPTLRNILEELTRLTAENNLIAVIGNCLSHDKNDIKAVNELLKMQKYPVGTGHVPV